MLGGFSKSAGQRTARVGPTNICYLDSADHGSEPRHVVRVCLVSAIAVTEVVAHASARANYVVIRQGALGV